MDKYYIPSAEEFCLGFEYEILTTNPQNDLGLKEEAVYSKAKFPDPFVGYNIDKIKNARVKHLDKSDIESLGWEFKYEKTNIEPYWFTKNIFSEKHAKSIEFQLITMMNGWVCISEQIQDTRFSGFIKNKSELSRIMKMLNISQ